MVKSFLKPRILLFLPICSNIFHLFDSNLIHSTWLLYILECFERAKDIAHENAIITETISTTKDIVSPLECFELCEAEIECSFFLVNLRNTNMRGCWLLKKDPHLIDPMTQTLVMGPSYCRKLFHSYSSVMTGK